MSYVGAHLVGVIGEARDERVDAADVDALLAAALVLVARVEKGDAEGSRLVIVLGRLKRLDEHLDRVLAVVHGRQKGVARLVGEEQVGEGAGGVAAEDRLIGGGGDHLEQLGHRLELEKPLGSGVVIGGDVLQGAARVGVLHHVRARLDAAEQCLHHLRLLRHQRLGKVGLHRAVE